jgi:uncharacterized protein
MKEKKARELCHSFRGIGEENQGDNKGKASHNPPMDGRLNHSQDTQDPFVHVFARDGRWFAYDVNTNVILTVEPVLAHLLQDSLQDSLGQDFSAAEVLEAKEALKTGQTEDGFFLPRTVQLIPHPAAGPGHDQSLRQLILSVTERCNLRCRYCFHTASRAGYRAHGVVDMTRETAVEATQFFLDRADPDHAPVISFYGGEPLLVPEVLKSVIESVRCHPRNPEVMLAVDTNGTLMNESMMDLVLEENIFLQVSLDGPREIHDRWRRDREGRPTFAVIMENLDRLLSRDPGVAPRISFVVTLTPESDLDAVSSFFAAFPPYLRHGVKEAPRLRVNVADLDDSISPDGAKNWSVLRRQLRQARDTYLEAVGAGARHLIGPVPRALFEPGIIKLHHRSRSPLGKVFTPGGNCRPGQRKLHVTAAGQFQPCEKVGSAEIIGDVATGIRRPAVTHLQRAFHESFVDSCQSCWAIRLCGQCFATHQALNHGDPQARKLACSRMRKRLEEGLGDLAKILLMPENARAWLDETVVD